jgi:hypothetical protein
MSAIIFGIGLSKQSENFVGDRSFTGPANEQLFGGTRVRLIGYGNPNPRKVKGIQFMTEVFSANIPSASDTSSWQPLNQELFIGSSIPIKTESNILLPRFPCSKTPIG